MWKFRDLRLSQKRIFPTLTLLSVLHFLWLFQLLKCQSRYMYTEIFLCGHYFTFNMQKIFKVSFSKLKTKKQTASKHLIQLKSKVKELNWTLLKLICFPRTFITCSDCPKRDIFHRTSFIQTSLFGYLFYCKLFFDEVDHRVFQYF